MSEDRVRLVTCIGVERYLELMPHFVEHYRGLGVAPANMIVILNTHDSESARLAQAKKWCDREGIRAETWIGQYSSELMWAKRREAQALYCDDADWVLSADVDEFHAYPEPLGQFLDRCEAKGINCIQGVFIDRIAQDGTLRSVACEPSLDEQFPLATDAMRAVGGPGHDRHGTVKVMALREGMSVKRGGHDPREDPGLKTLYRASLGQFTRIDGAAFRFAVPTRVYHYHWLASLPGVLEARLENPRINAHSREYGRRQLAYLARHDGVALADVSVDQGRYPRQNWHRRLALMRLQGWLMSHAFAVRRSIARLFKSAARRSEH